MKNIGLYILILAVLAVGYLGYKYMKGQGAMQYSAPSYSGPSQSSSAGQPAAGAGQNSVYSMSTGGTFGSFLTDPKGMTLYTFAKDSTGVSTCTGQCLVTWPAYVAPATTGTLPANVTVIRRPEGTMQYAWNGMPLYYYMNDKNPGDTNGQGIGGVWYVAK